MTMTDAIRITGLKKSYGSHAVLKGLDFHVTKGEVFALLGVNGAGKTTALECIEGLRSYGEGQVEINGKVGIQLQSSSLPDCIKPMEAVRLFAKWNKTRVDRSMLETLGLNEITGQYARLSTGQKRRLHLALALINDPDILFLDEPTSGLDVEGRIALHSQLHSLKAQGKTIILASHDMAEVEALCDRIAILNGGSIVFCGTVPELSNRVGKRYNIQVKTAQGEKKLETDNITDTLLALLKKLKRENIEVLDIKVDRGSLEQHFIEMAGRTAQ